MTREEEIRRAADNYVDNFGCKKKDMPVLSAYYLGYVAGAEWADAHQPSPWISVEDRLPEEGDLVLAMSETKNDGGIVCGISASKYTDGKFINENKYSFSDNTGVFFKMDNEIVLFNITHWMPIPEFKQLNKQR